MKEFTSAAKSAASEALGNPAEIKFSLDGRVLVIQPPKSGQLAYLMAMQSDSIEPTEQFGAIFDFFRALMEEDDYKWLREQLRTGALDIDTLMEVMEYLITEWTAVPTGPASASPRRQGSTGKSSTAKRLSKARTS